MSRQQPKIGDVGEGHAHGFLLGSFEHCARPESGSPLDWVCRGLKRERGSWEIHGDPTIEVHVQVKSREPGCRKASFPVGRATFGDWMTLFERQPVVLVYVDPVSVKTQE